jgi:protein gp37
MSKTKIEWTEKVWNPCTGCTKVSQGCGRCYAEVIANRFPRTGIIPGRIISGRLLDGREWNEYPEAVK